MPRRKKRVGNQKPTFERIGKYHHSDAKACINMFSHYGFKLDDAQKYELELYMAKVCQRLKLLVQPSHVKMVNRLPHDSTAFGVQPSVEWMLSIQLTMQIPLMSSLI